MSSPTLLHILNRWCGDPTKEESPVKLPFYIEDFCRENDDKIKLLETRLQELNKALLAVENLIMGNGPDGGIQQRDWRTLKRMFKI